MSRAYLKYLELNPRAKNLDALSKRLVPFGVAIWAGSILWALLGFSLFPSSSFILGAIGPIFLSLVGGGMVAFRFVVLAIGEFRAMNAD